MKTDPLEDLLEFLRFPSISTDSSHSGDVDACSQWLVEKLTKMGLETQRFETQGHPIVVAKSAYQESKKDVLIYGHYDVQPVDPLELWDHPPFDPIIKDGRVWARGATDNKGQMLAHILGVQQALENEGQLPVNLTFLFEGEEEIGSPNLVPFIQKHRDLLKCDVIALSDTGMVQRGVPTMGYGLRGIACCEVTLKGPESDLHSGVYGGALANPATALSQLIASLHEFNGQVAIEGFYDDVRALEDWEREMWSDVPGMGDEQILQLTGVPELYGEEGYSSAERLWARPTAEVNGLSGGYQGEGSKTVLPSQASAKLSFRLVPDQDPKDIIEKFKKHLQKHLPKGVQAQVEVGHDGKAYITDPHSHYGKASQRALTKVFGKEPVLIREGGSIPIIKDMQDILGADSMLLGLALPDCQIHAPNENFWVENFLSGIELNQVLLQEIAEV